MQPTTSGTYRVLDDPRGEWLLVDRETTETIAATGGDLAAGNLIDATVEWDDGDARLHDFEVIAGTRLHFRREVTDLFEVARELCRSARAQDEGVIGETTYDTDNRPNGAVYVFAEQSGARDVWDELRTGAIPLEPLIDRLGDFSPEPYEIFVLDPVDEPFVVVYLVPDPESVLAETVRETYL
ncbi:DUF6663 family protein [Halalkalicoccus jeotgali]|uniref:Uncharacterized protein n=1 Tax=Halalkalicoccus jeotgali (strain DSM 18796 / CECT 7217 / JCM 14584 / KCTC 4019 / B3) TaxID=795797 RepID=D8J3Z6_HALJB|nr:DUF6663 family protein [Halalkalicoccus jeotgali]ADJ15388.1 hypothetical protein HacjB3_10025 [Halalkalicoccus jeotgali B3]ELY35836.1 hypothetical protein C497_12646 [Halalkalicoccus jeotgali B3]